MADSSEEKFAFNLLARYYEGVVPHDQLELYFHLLPYSANNRPQSVLRVCDGVLLNSCFIEEQEAKLLHCSTHWELRNRILSTLGFRISEADEVMNRINVNYQSPLRIPRAFRGSGTKNTLSRPDLIDAAYIAAFLETSVLVLLVDRPELIRQVPTQPWYYFLKEEVDDVSKLALPVPLVPDSYEAWPPSLSDLSDASMLGKGMNVGRFHVDGLGEVGATVLYSSSFVQVSFTVDSDPHAYWADWEFRLESFARKCGIGGPCVYSLATPFLSAGAGRIHRMTWLLSQSPVDKIRLYSRVFSPRTIEISVIADKEIRTIKHPYFNRDQVVRALMELSIVDPTVPCEQDLVKRIFDLAMRSMDDDDSVEQ